MIVAATLVVLAFSENGFAQETQAISSPSALLEQAGRLAASGSYQPAADKIELALELARRTDDAAAICRGALALGEIDIARGRFKAAEASLSEAEALGEKLAALDVVAHARRGRAQLSLLAGDREASEAHLDRAMAAARTDGDPGLRLRVATSAARASLLLEQATSFAPAPSSAPNSAPNSAPTSDRLTAFTAEALAILSEPEDGSGDSARRQDRLHLAGTLAEWAELLRRAGRGRQSAEIRLRAFALYRSAIVALRAAALEPTANMLNEEANAQLGLAGLYRAEARIDEARQHANRSALIAQQIGAKETLHRAEQEIGRLFVATGDLDGALGAFERSLETLETVRGRLAMSFERDGRPFREGRGAVYYELVDVLLRKAAAADSSGEEVLRLRRARDVVERMKADELRDYLGDECIDRALSSARSIDDVAGDDAVVVYPIALDGRLELLVTHAGRLQRFPVPVDRQTLERTARTFRRQLEDAPRRSYLRPAAQLYDWLVRPWSALLDDPSIRTVVFIPDGALRSIPPAALHDGKGFLIERVATAVAPGLSLLDPHPIDLANARVLAAGISEARLGFASLPHVVGELDRVRSRLGARVLLNEKFTYEGWRSAIQSAPWSVLHIATHAEFRQRSDESYLLTHDRRLPMDHFEELIGGFEGREQPLELLVLSACETAAGGDRASLGLSGVAVRSGARSVVGTLWTVDDAATALLIDRFYTQLLEEGTSRAEALRAAQRALIEDDVLGHPAYWSPFLLINNWI